MRTLLTCANRVRTNENKVVRTSEHHIGTLYRGPVSVRIEAPVEVEIEMIKVEPCKGCGGVLLVDRFMGVTVRCDPTPLDAQAAGQALLAALPLHRVYALGGRPSSFGSASPAVLGALRTEPSERPIVVPEHRCTKAGTTNALSGPVSASEVVDPKGVHAAPLSPSQPLPAGRTTPSSGLPSPAPAKNVGQRASDPSGPRCSGCGEPCADGTYASIELGKILVWAHHVTSCG